jgi:hypothetical protein
MEMAVEGRDAHPGLPRQLLDAERLRFLGVDLAQDRSDAGEVVVAAGQGVERPALLAAEDGVDDLAGGAPGAGVRPARGLGRRPAGDGSGRWRRRAGRLPLAPPRGVAGGPRDVHGLRRGETGRVRSAWEATGALRERVCELLALETPLKPVPCEACSERPAGVRPRSRCGGAGMDRAD